MNKYVALMLSLSLLAYNTPVTASDGGGGGRSSLIAIGAGILRIIGIAYVVGGLYDIDQKSKDPETANENYDARKLALLTTAGIVSTSFYPDWLENSEKWVLFCTLLGLTHITANNEALVRSLENTQGVGPWLTDKKDKDGKRHGSLGTMVRYISTYFGYRSIAKFLGLGEYLLT